MKRSIVLMFVVFLLLAIGADGQLGVTPPACPDVTPAVPTECLTPKDWPAAVACLNKLVQMHPTIFPGAVMGYLPDGGTASLQGAGPGFANNSVASLASVSKPLVYVGLAKLVQDHYASPACTPMTAKCVFPQKFQTRLVDALRVLDAQRGTAVLKEWYEPQFHVDGDLQWKWKSAMTIQHIAQMTSGWPSMAFTGYQFCPGGVCPPLLAGDQTCNPDLPGACRQAMLYNQYLNRRGAHAGRLIPNGCRPRGLNGPALFNFSNYNDPDRLWRKFERRYSYEPGLYGECVLLDDAAGARWVDGRTAHESDVAKFSLGIPLISEPGRETHYAQPNLYVAAFLIEGVSGLRFDDYLKAQLFTPLGMNDTSFVIRPGTTQYQRLLDIKRVPITPARAVPDLPAPLQPDVVYGADKNWDEPRTGWSNRWPEGGAYSTALDLLRFLRFLRTGRAPDGRVLLNAESLAHVTTEVAPGQTRTYAFRREAPPPAPQVIVANGYFTPMMRRNIARCQNIVVLMQTLQELPGLDPHGVQRCDYQYHDVANTLRNALVRMIDGIPAACD
jgi:CubicO group peptidase (beta-lactamase class C family)